MTDTVAEIMQLHDEAVIAGINIDSPVYASRKAALLERVAARAALESALRKLVEELDDYKTNAALSFARAEQESVKREKAEAEAATLRKALDELLVAEKLDDYEPRLIAAREQAKAALAAKGSK